ncbi:MAG TPA: single-stranded DNA endonuclease [Maribacter sp.]|nr:single-stranded DNA endonuclease [Maribacter sp.]|tara:strand:+ start:371 stop:694 length:324 start_codon:yes stop_codon:yes gene_type:complete
MEGSIMHLLTKKIEEKATKQYELGSDLEKQNVVAKFFNPTGEGTWYLMNMKGKDYAWGIVDWIGLEIGSFSINELEEVKLPFGMGIERDLYFEEVPAIDIWNKLSNR